MLIQPSLVLTQVLSLACNLLNCDKGGNPSPVSFLPEGFRAESVRRSSARTGKQFGGYNSDNSSVVDSSSGAGTHLSGNDIINDLEDLLPPIVNTKMGDIEGFYMKVISGKDIYAFEGIPYAEPPIGDNRFSAPIPKAPWTGTTLQAKDHGESCMQFRGRGVQGSEDCLHLNVYSPKIPNGGEKPKLPVLIFIHGGLFSFGSGFNHGPAYLLQEDIIVVTMNYRLGLFGFFTTGDEVASGNWGLKDQALSINWIYDHIESFGGDPKRITVLGQSAGAVSTHLHMMSPHTRDKINSAILLSGSAYHFWGFNTLERAKEITKDGAKLAVCPVERGSQAMVECMRKVPANVIAANVILTVGWRTPVPHVEPDCEGAFITETPDEAYQRGHVAKIPVIATTTSQEANVVTSQLMSSRALPVLGALFDMHAAFLLGIRDKISNAKTLDVVLRIRQFYGVGLQLFVLPREFYTEVSNARFFTVAYQKSIKMHSQIASTYAGVFSYANDKSTPAKLGFNSREHGVGHTDDLLFLFNSTYFSPIARSDENFAVTKLLLNIYANYMEKGVPTYTALEDGKEKDYNFWETVKDPENIRLLQIDEEVKMIANPYKNITDFWESLELPDMTPYFKI